MGSSKGSTYFSNPCVIAKDRSQFMFVSLGRTMQGTLWSVHSKNYKGACIKGEEEALHFCTLESHCLTCYFLRPNSTFSLIVLLVRNSEKENQDTQAEVYPDTIQETEKNIKIIFFLCS